MDAESVGGSEVWGRCVWAVFALVVLATATLLVLVRPASAAAAGDDTGWMLLAVAAGPGDVASGVVAQGGGLCDSSGVSQFRDVGAGDYGAAYILCMRALGLSLGTGTGDYGPGRELTRGQMASFLVRLWRDVLGMDCPSGGTPFTDIGGGVHAGNIVCLYNLGITKGKTATTYEPQGPLTASQISRFLFRTYERADRSCADEASELDEAVACLQTLRVIPSAEEGRSDEAVTRAQMAVYVIGLWHNLAGRDLPPVPPELSSGDAYQQPDDSLQKSGGLSDIIPSPEDDDSLQKSGGLSDIIPSPEDHARYYQLEGTVVVTVFICGPEGKYTTHDDLSKLTALANRELDGFFERLSSGRLSVVFTEGSVVSPDLRWQDGPLTTAEIARVCQDSAWEVSSTQQVLVAVDVPDVAGSDGRGGGGRAIILTPDRFRSEERLHYVIVHELGHSLLGLHHLKFVWFGPIWANESLPFRSFLSEPKLVCYQYYQLGWPVPEYAQPCVRLTPSEPESVSITQMGDYAVTVAWEPPRFTDDAPISGYTVHLVDARTGNTIVINKAADERSHTFDRIVNNPGRYTFTVNANTRYGAGDTNSYYIEIPPAPPPPDPIRVAATTDTGLDLSWRDWDRTNNRNYVNLRYEVQYSTAGTTAKGEASSGSIASLSGLEPDTAYTIKVRSCTNSSFIRVCGEWATMTVSTQAVLPPPDPVSVEVGHNWYLLSWEPIPGVSSYQIEQPNGAWTTSHTPDFGKDIGVEPGTTHSVKVRSCNREDGFCDWGEWTTVTFTTTNQPSIPPPYRVTVKKIDDTSVVLLWDSIGGGPGRYTVEYEYTDGITTSGLQQYQVRGGILPNIPIEPDTTYTLKIRNCGWSQDNPFCSTWTSHTFSTTPTTQTSDLAQPSVSATDLGDIWLAFSWESVAGASSYDWRYSTSGGDPKWGNYTLTFFELSFVEPNTTYTVDVRACGGPTEPCSEWTTVDLTTLGSLPAAPPSYPVTVTEVTDNRIYLSWNPPDPDATYELRWFASEAKHNPSCCLPSHAEDLLHDWVIPELRPKTTYTINVRTCSISENNPCDDWVTIEVTTLPQG